MAKNKIDECLFCGSIPCVCNKSARTAKPKEQSARPPRSTVKIPTRAAPSSVPPKQTRIAIRNIRSQEETDLRDALTAIADAELLAADELERHRAMIDLPSWRVDALIWRQR